MRLSSFVQQLNKKSADATAAPDAKPSVSWPHMILTREEIFKDCSIAEISRPVSSLQCFIEMSQCVWLFLYFFL